MSRVDSDLILVASCWMVAPWLPTVLNMMVDIPHHCPVVNDLIVEVFIGHVLKSMLYLHLTLWLLRDMCCADRGSILQSVR